MQSGYACVQWFENCNGGTDNGKVHDFIGQSEEYALCIKHKNTTSCAVCYLCVRESMGEWTMAQLTREQCKDEM